MATAERKAVAEARANQHNQEVVTHLQDKVAALGGRLRRRSLHHRRFRARDPQEEGQHDMRKILGTTSSGARMFASSLSASSTSAPLWKPHALYILGSIVLIRCTPDHQVRKLFSQGRPASAKGVMVGGETLSLDVAVQETKAERTRDKRHASIAGTRQQALRSENGIDVAAGMLAQCNGGDRRQKALLPGGG